MFCPSQLRRSWNIFAFHFLVSFVFQELTTKSATVKDHNVHVKIVNVFLRKTGTKFNMILEKFFLVPWSSKHNGWEQLKFASPEGGGMGIAWSHSKRMHDHFIARISYWV
jgi:hypothetical protein